MNEGEVSEMRGHVLEKFCFRREKGQSSFFVNERDEAQLTR